MRCNFCETPAAHDATGARYGPDTLACADCVKTFWCWARQHINGVRKGQPSFYDAAGKWHSQ